MIRVTLKGVRGHLLRFLLTVASVTLGTALIAGTFVLTDSINKTFDKIFDQASNGVDVTVRGLEAGTLGEGMGNVREQLPVTLVDRLRSVPGVTRVAPDYQGSIVLVGKDGTAVRNGGAPTLGFAYTPDDPALTLVAGHAPHGRNEVVVESSTLDRAKLHVGDHTQALIGTRPVPVTIAGEVTFDAAIAGATLVAVDQPTAQSAFAPDGRVSSFSVTGSPGVSQAELRDRIALLLPPKAEAVTMKAANEQAKKELHDALGFINTFLLVFAFVSVFVGAFIIFNTFFMLVAQRTRELALLRAVGASQGQVQRVVLGEAVVVGLAGGLVGLGVGIALASGLQALFKSFGLEISGGLPVLPRTVVWTVSTGVLVTLLAAIYPAVRASRIAPVEALRDDLVRPVRSVRRLGAVGLAMITAGAVMIVPIARQSSVNWWAFLGAALLLLIGCLVAAPLATRPVIRVVTWPFVAIFGVVGRLARENGLRVPTRTAITASALMIGVTLMAAVSVLAQSTKASVADIVDRQLTADFVLNGGQQVFPTTVVDEVRKVPGVRSAAGIAVVPVKPNGSGVLSAVATDAGSITSNVRTYLTAGSISALDSGQVVVDGKVAKDRDWTVGTSFTSRIGTLQQETLTIGAIAKPNTLLGAQLVMPRSVYLRAVPPAQQGDFQAYVKVAPGADPAKVRAALAAKVKPYLVVSVQDAKEFTDSQASQVNTMLTIMYVLLALSVIIAVLGIINTLALSIFERTREIGLLRAVGLSRGQLSRIITIEAVATAVFGALLGTALGLGLGVAVRQALVDQGLGTLMVPWSTMVWLVVAAAAAGVVAAVLPAIRAVRLNVLRAITTE